MVEIRHASGFVEEVEVPNMLQLQSVLALRRAGWWITNTHLATKKLTRPGWNMERPDEPDLVRRFSEPQNICALWGLAPLHLVDVDLDASEAAAAFRLVQGRYLPLTEAIYGHRLKPFSHWVYRLSSAVGSNAGPNAGPNAGSVDEANGGETISEGTVTIEHWDDPDARKGMIELRGTGHQSIIPRSIHEGTGNPVLWEVPIYNQPGSAPPQPAAVSLDRLRAACDRAAALALIARNWSESIRHRAALALAGGLARAGWPQEDALCLIEDICILTEDTDEFIRQDRTIAIANTYRKYLSGDTKLAGWPTLADLFSIPVVKAIRHWLGVEQRKGQPTLDDIGNAARLFALHGDSLRYVIGADQWYTWQGVRWHRAETAQALALVPDIRETILAEYKDCQSDDQRKQILKHWHAAGDMRTQKRCLEALSVNPGIWCKIEDFDRDPLDLNLLNGTFNFNSLELRPHRREDLITKLAPVRYEPQREPDPRWESFLDDTTASDSELRGYLQEAAGLTLTGLTNAEAAFIAWGPGATGKSTFLETLRSVLGEYSASIAPETLLQSHNASGGSPRPDVAKLQGVRMVTVSEFNPGRRVATGLFKALVSGDKIAARFLHKNEFEFWPVCKLWVATNVRPPAPSEDDGYFRRAKLIEFNQIIPVEQRDPAIKSYLTDPFQAGSAILNWMIEGYNRWVANGRRLREPDSVQHAVHLYREEMDPFRDFFEDRCLLEAETMVPSSELLAAYADWCKRQGQLPINNPNAWSNRLHSLGCKPGRTTRQGKSIRVWKGIRILPLLLDPESLGGFEEEQKSGH